MLRIIMMRNVGVVRDRVGLQNALDALLPMAPQSDMALVASMVTWSALQRAESRGAQARRDYPETLPAWQHHQTVTLADLFPNSTAPSCARSLR